MKVKIIFLLSILIFGLTSCEGESDTTGPAIELSSVEPGAEFRVGTNISLRLKFRDDSGIEEYKIEVFSNESGVETFNYEKEYPMEMLVNYYEIGHTISIPERGSNGVALETANYIIRIIAKDIVSNKTTFERNIRIVAD